MAQTWDKVLEEVGIFEEEAKQKARLILDQQQRVQPQYLATVLKILTELDLEDIKVRLVGKDKMEAIKGVLEIPWEEAQVTEKSFYEALVAEHLTQTIQQGIEDDTEYLEIASLLDHLELKGKEIHFTSFIRLVPFLFQEPDPQIQALEDYLVIKDNYNLLPSEIERLSRKQKKYLVFKAKIKSTHEKS